MYQPPPPDNPGKVTSPAMSSLPDPTPTPIGNTTIATASPSLSTNTTSVTNTAQREANEREAENAQPRPEMRDWGVRERDSAKIERREERERYSDTPGEHTIKRDRGVERNRVDDTAAANENRDRVRREREREEREKIARKAGGPGGVGAGEFFFCSVFLFSFLRADVVPLEPPVVPLPPSTSAAAAVTTPRLTASPRTSLTSQNPNSSIDPNVNANTSDGDAGKEREEGEINELSPRPPTSIVSSTYASHRELAKKAERDGRERERERDRDRDRDFRSWRTDDYGVREGMPPREMGRQSQSQMGVHRNMQREREIDKGRMDAAFPSSNGVRFYLFFDFFFLNSEMWRCSSLLMNLSTPHLV